MPKVKFKVPSYEDRKIAMKREREIKKLGSKGC